MLLINVGSQRDGYTFSLDPLSVRELKNSRPDVHPLSRIFIAADDMDLSSMREDLFGEVAELLTRLQGSEIDSLGGFQIVDPVRNSIIYPNAS